MNIKDYQAIGRAAGKAGIHPARVKLLAAFLLIERGCTNRRQCALLEAELAAHDASQGRQP